LKGVKTIGRGGTPANDGVNDSPEGATDYPTTESVVLSGQPYGWLSGGYPRL